MARNRLMAPNDLLAELPGEDLIRGGLSDLQTGRWTVPACPEVIAFPRMRRAGLVRGAAATAPAGAELELYRMLRQTGGNAYSRYNALLRQLVSFEQALDRRRRQCQP